jgi:dihydropteroate synthase
MEGTLGPNLKRQKQIGEGLKRVEGGSCHIMGVLNATPDSFHEQSRVEDIQLAVETGLAMWQAGATWIDLGGESTRPGAAPVDEQEEIQRVVPIIQELRANNSSGLISIDTRRPAVARAALLAGADLVNDVSGLRDPRMIDLVLEAKCGVCIMHMQGTPGSMQADPTYDDCVEEISSQLLETARALVAAGHPADLIALDPGIGFGKTLDHNIQLLHHPEAFRGVENFAILWGVSRKSMIGSITERNHPSERLAGTLGAAAVAHYEQVDLLRVHDVEEHIDLLKVLNALS